jgi:hypothetical protein
MYGVPDYLIDEFFAACSPNVDGDLRLRIEELAPSRPPWVPATDQACRRWIGASLVAAAVALDQAAGDGAAAASFATAAARTLYRDTSFA